MHFGINCNIFYYQCTFFSSRKYVVILKIAWNTNPKFHDIFTYKQLMHILMMLSNSKFQWQINRFVTTGWSNGGIYIAVGGGVWGVTRWGTWRGHTWRHAAHSGVTGRVARTRLETQQRAGVTTAATQQWTWDQWSSGLLVIYLLLVTCYLSLVGCEDGAELCSCAAGSVHERTEDWVKD